LKEAQADQIEKRRRLTQGEPENMAKN
jgi:hypothetical protein